MSAPQNETTMEVIGNRLARLEAERDRLRKALECLTIAVAGAGVPIKAERELLHEQYREAVSLLAALQEATDD